jgi:hypothetical protein
VRHPKALFLDVCVYVLAAKLQVIYFFIAQFILEQVFSNFSGSMGVWN